MMGLLVLSTARSSEFGRLALAAARGGGASENRGAGQGRAGQDRAR